MRLRWINVNMLVSKPVGNVENHEKWRRQPHGPSVNVVTNGLGSRVHWWVGSGHLKKQQLDFPLSSIAVGPPTENSRNFDERAQVENRQPDKTNYLIIQPPNNSSSYLAEQPYHQKTSCFSTKKKIPFRGKKVFARYCLLCLCSNKHKGLFLTSFVFLILSWRYGRREPPGGLIDVRDQPRDFLRIRWLQYNLMLVARPPINTNKWSKAMTKTRMRRQV